MKKVIHFLLLPLIVCSVSCHTKGTNSYAITDFRKSLQPLLTKIVTDGIVRYQDSLTIKKFSDAELMRLTRAENPILRATALWEMLYRPSFKTFDVVMDHLDDTAIVATDNGEFGIKLETVTDCLIKRCRWESLEERAKTIESVLTKHNYLSSAYTILTNLEPNEKYYPFIKAMATRPRRFDNYYGIETAFYEIEYALYCLAAFRKKEDIPIIKEVLMNNDWQISDVSFRIMTAFPDSAFFDLLRAYYHRSFYKFSGNRPHGFTGIAADKAAPEDFIKALVAQQNEKSAKLLDTMLTYLPIYPCLPDRDIIFDELVRQIWEHPCPSYTQIRRRIRQKAEKIIAKDVNVPIDKVDYFTDTSKRTYSWYY